MRRSLIAALALLAVAAPASAVAAEDRVFVLRGAGLRVVVEPDPWRLRVTDTAGRPILSEARPGLPDPPANADRAAYDGGSGPDVAYPGLASVTYQPLSYLREGRWQRVTALRSARRRGPRAATLRAATSDGREATVTLRIERDATVRLSFIPPPGATAVEEAFVKPPDARIVGGGQRFGAIDQTGRSVPLWISHGIGSDRYGSTNEIAFPFLMSTGGWGMWARGHARGELNVALPGERPDALNVVLEDDRLDLDLYTGRPADVLAAHTARAGRPRAAPPEWALRPMFWEDDDTSQASATALLDRLQAAKIPVGAIWIDNPWEARKGDFAPDPRRFPDFDGFARALHERGVKLMAWTSPFVPDDAPDRVTGTPDGDQTYLGGRRLDPHHDLTDPRAAERMTDKATALLLRGVDGFKLDRGEEDLGDGARYASGEPNRLVHNRYVLRYQAALAAACARARKPDGCFLIARGGASGTPALAASWAGDNLSLPGKLGLGQALNSLLSLSLSGQPVSGSDIGGYVGTRKDNPSPSALDFPQRAVYLRWAQLGALSPIMETDLDPTARFADPEVVRIFRRFAIIHDRLAPYTGRAAREAIRTGMPIVRPLMLAYPGDPVAVRIDDQYLFGPDLLVAPIVDPVSELGAPDVRPVYLPAGGWTDAWTGERFRGPLTLPVAAPLDRMPLFVRDGARLPAGLFEDLP